MVQGVTLDKLKNYLKRSQKTGVFSYRRAIPSKLSSYFLNADGTPKGREWKESLKTKDKAKALQLCAELNLRFERVKHYAKMAVDSQKLSVPERAEVERFIDYCLQHGIHPTQAPSILAPESVKRAWVKKSEKLRHELEDLELEYLDEDAFGEPHVTEASKFVRQQIDFLEGRASGIEAKLRPSLATARDAYLSEHRLTGSKLARGQQNKRNTAMRAVHNFSVFLGRGNPNIGLARDLTSITRNEAKRYLDHALSDLGISGENIGKQLSVLSAIYNLSKRDDYELDPLLATRESPFTGLRTKATAYHEEKLRLGEVETSAARAWTKDEYSAFMERLPLMNSELQLIALISMHTGARLTDTTGLLWDDVELREEDNSLINYRHNKIRKITKSSIERKVPIYGDLLRGLFDYKAAVHGVSGEPIFPRYAGKDTASATLNNSHLDMINKDKRFKMHGLRNTFQAKADAVGVSLDQSGYLVGWRNSMTVGMQKRYQQGYPHSDLLQVIKAVHSAKDWAVDN